MTETISRGNVQALRTFFSQHFESMKANTQPRNKNQKSKSFVKSSVPILSCSKQDLRTNSDSSSISRSLSVFDLPNNVKLATFCRSQHIALKSNEELIKSRDIGFDTLSNDSGVEENYESTSGDSRQSSVFRNRLCSDSYYSDGENDLKSPSINIIIKPPLLKSQNSLKEEEKQRNVMTVWNKTYEVDISQEIEKRLISSPQKLFYSEVFINNNYVCKAQYKRIKIPSLDLLGPPPSKPVKPTNITIPSSLGTKFIKEKPPISKKPSRLPPPPPSSVYKNQNRSCSSLNIAEEHSNGCSITKIYKPLLQQGTDFNDAENINTSQIRNNLPHPPTLPPRKFSYHLGETNNNFSDVLLEELYQDTQVNDDKIYEEMPFSDYELQIYSKGGKLSKSQRDLLKGFQKEQKEQERRERELDKGKKRFGLTGDEIPLEKGYVKNDRRGSQYDLAVKKGEILLILRMENNPIGRWLVKNDKGKIGYVELDNIRVDANSIKSVMKERRASMESRNGRSCSASSNEAIYEEAC